MKRFFYYAFAAMAAICMTACSSDDDDDNSTTNEVTLPTPENANDAVQFVFSTPKASESTAEDAPQIKAIDITESSDIMIELRHPVSGTTVYVKEKATINGNTYTVNGTKVKGTVKVVENGSRITRSGSAELIVNLDVVYTSTEVYQFKTDDGSTITVIKETPMTGDAAMDRLARTWNVLGIILDLKSSDVKAYKKWEATNGIIDLEKTLLKEALDQGVNLNADEQAELKKKVKSVTITKTRLFSIDYVDGSEDAATWNWADSNKSKVTIQLKDGKMGNKFIQDATDVSFDFKDDRCNMKMVTTFDDNSNKKWDVTLTIQLQSPK